MQYVWGTKSRRIPYRHSVRTMAFILSKPLLCIDSLHRRSLVTCCVEQSNFWRVPKLSAATVLVSAALLTTPALAEDKPLVFDHDQTLGGANFENRTDLRGAIFSKANCRGASFLGSDLTGAQLDDANVGCNLAISAKK